MTNYNPAEAVESLTVMMDSMEQKYLGDLLTHIKYICHAIFVLSCLRYGECDDKSESELPQHQGDHLSPGVTASQRSVLLSYCDREQHFLRAGTPAGGL